MVVVLLVRVANKFMWYEFFFLQSSEMRDIGRKIARSSVAETMTPEQRLDEIENKLSKLSEKWKEKVTNNDVRRPQEKGDLG